MPVKSKAQQAFMAMSESPAGRAKLKATGHKPAPMGVANEFLKASKGLHNLPKRAKK